MSALSNSCLSSVSVPQPLSINGSVCTIYAPSPNETYAEKIRGCCKGAEVHYIGNSTTEVPMEESCISYCSYPDFGGNSSASSTAFYTWGECVGADIGVHCQAPPTEEVPSGLNTTTFCRAGDIYTPFDEQSCTVSVYSPNETLVQRISSCCKGAQVGYLGSRGRPGVPVEQSCQAYCAYPGQDRHQAYLDWAGCLGDIFPEDAQRICTVTVSGSGTAAIGSGGGRKSVFALATIFILPWAVSTVFGF